MFTVSAHRAADPAHAGAAARPRVRAVGHRVPDRQRGRAAARRRADDHLAARAVPGVRGAAAGRGADRVVVPAQLDARRAGRRSRPRVHAAGGDAAPRVLWPRWARPSRTAGRCSACGCRWCRCSSRRSCDRDGAFAGTALAVFAAGNVRDADGVGPARRHVGPQADCADGPGGVGRRHDMGRVHRPTCRCSWWRPWSPGSAAGLLSPPLQATVADVVGSRGRGGPVLADVPDGRRRRHDARPDRGRSAGRQPVVRRGVRGDRLAVPVWRPWLWPRRRRDRAPPDEAVATELPPRT